MPQWSNILFLLLSFILFLRLIIGQFIRGVDVVAGDGLANLCIALLIVAVSFPWIILKIIRRQPLVHSGVGVPILLICGTAGLSLLYTADLPISLKGVLVLFSNIIFFYIFLDVLKTQKQIWMAVWMFVTLAIASSVFGIKTYWDFCHLTFLLKDPAFMAAQGNLAYLIEQRRAISFFGWPNTLAGYLLLFMPLGLCLIFHFKIIWQKFVAAGIFFLMLLCFLYTFSFLGWISFLISACCAAPIFWKLCGIHAWPTNKKRMLFYVLAGCGVFFILVICRKNFLGSLAPRLIYYKQAFAYLLFNPFWGNGWDTFEIVCRSMTTDRSILSTFVHNSYLQVWVEAGILGVTGILLLARGFFKKIFRVFHAQRLEDVDYIALGVSWGVLAFFIDNLFSFTFLKPIVSLFAWAMMALVCAQYQLKFKPDGKSPFKYPKFLNEALLIVLVVMIVVVSRLFVGNILFYQAKNTLRDVPRPVAFKLLREAGQWDPWSSYIPAAQGEWFLQEYGQNRSIAFLKLAGESYHQAILRSPHVYNNYFVLSKIYEGLGDQARFLSLSAKAHKLSPAEFVSDEQAYQARRQ